MMIDYEKFLRKERTRAVLTNQLMRIPVMDKFCIKDGKIIGVAKSGECFIIKNDKRES